MQKPDVSKSQIQHFCAGNSFELSRLNQSNNINPQMMLHVPLFHLYSVDLKVRSRGAC